ncbi:prefoldin subunit alpha [Candidatus Woesearchaeota archaeon]|nr:prefoldin subunit alpha [Candidatus Woesearchaeota archaeon]
MQAKKNEDSEGINSLNENIQQLQQQLEIIRQECSNISTVAECLERLKDMKEEDEILVSVGKGVLLKAKINDTKNVVMEIGGSSLMNKKIDDAKKTVENELAEMSHYADECEKELKNMVLVAKNLRK